jgi:hypothetical protein
MTQQYATGILVVAMAAVSMVPAYGRQDERVEPSQLIAVRLRPDTLATFINDVAGMRVRLVNGVVNQVASARVFVLKSERSARYPHRPNEVAIVVDAGSAFVREGAPVVVTGIARTLLGAEMSTGRPLASLTDSERLAVTNRPLVMASSVQTPDGVQLMRP